MDTQRRKSQRQVRDSREAHHHNVPPVALRVAYASGSARTYFAAVDFFASLHTVSAFSANCSYSLCARQPRVDPQASSYWQEDTVSSQEIARAMDEEVDALDEDGKKTNGVLAPAVALVGDEQDSRRFAFRGLLSPLTALLGPDGMALEDVAGLRVADMGSSPVNAHLSPAGLISIAAADIDEAATNSSQNVPPVNGELDVAFIRSLRQMSGEAETEARSCNVLQYVHLGCC